MKWLFIFALIGIHLYSLNHFQPFFAVVYMVVIVYLTVDFVKCQRAFERGFEEEQLDLGQIRIYEPPSSLPPLLVAFYVFGQDLVKLSPNGYSTKDGISFSTMVQSTLLDLLDRGCLVLEQEPSQTVLRLSSTANLVPFETEFIQLVFGEQDKISLSEVFGHKTLHFDSGTTVEEAHRAKLKRGNDLILRRMRIRNLVEKQIEEEGLPPLHRSLTDQEKRALSGLDNRFFLLFFLTIYLGTYAMGHLSFWMLGIVVPCVIVLFRKWESYRGNVGIVSHPDGDRVPHREGYREQLLWRAFRQALEEQEVFDEKVVQDHILWNRYLVYGVLFGQTKTIHQTLQLAYPDSMMTKEEVEQLSPKTPIDWKKVLVETFLGG
ncbi:hypothetical protein ABID29_001243 [Streptococcus rupicaprae]|uniref:Predicted membrane protein YciQ-like C-terminal domain-containing protein n=1 Tax=Streptococcus rupicaprae TaxID=759619 RepID=A0ABV2FHU3_9STRE